VVTFGPATAALLTTHRERQEAERRVVRDAWLDAGWCSPPRSAVGSTRARSAV
jgi:hypothetical protein